MPPGPSWRPGWPARTPCRRRPRSMSSCPGGPGDQQGQADHGRLPVGDKINAILEARARRPQAIAEAAAARRRRPSLLGEDNRIFIIAADHPARGALRAGDRPMAMADRADLLERMSLALARPGVEGVLGTADIIEDLLLLGALDDQRVRGHVIGPRLDRRGQRPRRG